MTRSRFPLLVAAIAAAGALTACSDDRASVTQPGVPSQPEFQSYARGVFQRFVAIGTSVSMGWRSDGVLASAQQTSWPVYLAELAGRPMSVPAIAAPGCGAPMAAPLAAGRRINAEGLGTPMTARVCAPNLDGVTLPAANVAITAATALNALYTTPENVTGDYTRLYSRVLAPGQTQVTAMMAQEPKVVTIELGANELLGSRNGVYLPGVTVMPTHVFEAMYLQILDSAQKVAKHVALVGLIDRAASFPSFRTGHELWEAQATFAPLNVAVSADCENSPNLIFVAARVPDAAARGQASHAAGTGPHVFSCVNYPSSTGIQDYVLGPDDVAALDGQLAQMDAIIAREAQRRGWAHFRLSALYDVANVKAPFDAAALMTTMEPYGPLMSLDGFHPSAAGARVLAQAAARAFNVRYGMGIPETPSLFARR